MKTPSIELRIARATHQIERITAFYRDGLGFALVGNFDDHAGYSGAILALPGGAQLEITQHARGRVGAAPDPDDLLVIYLPAATLVERIRERLVRLGHAEVPPLNPYWLDRSVTFADPDGWRIVLCDATRA